MYDFLSDKSKRAVQETGKERKISGISCDEYMFDLKVSHLPMSGSVVTQHDTGTACVSETTPEGSEITNFIQEARKRGFILAVRLLSPSRSSIGPEFFGDERNMLVVTVMSESRFEPAFGKTSSISFFTDVSAIDALSSDAIPDEEFRIPPDWKQKQK